MEKKHNIIIIMNAGPCFTRPNYDSFIQYNIFTVILCMVRLLFAMTVNHLQEKLCFDTCCYYFSVFQSLLFCSKIHMCKQTHDIRTMELTHHYLSP